MALSRRDFLQAAGLASLAAGSGVRAWADPAAKPGARTLVLVQLAGGNDDLNTVVPVADPLYRKLRPGLGLAAGETLPLAEGLGLNGAMAKLHARFTQGQVAIVRGVGYPGQSRSHFESTAVWQTGRLGGHLDGTGWLGRALEAQPEKLAGPFALVGVGGGSLSPSLSAGRAQGTALSSLEAFAAQPDKRFPGDAPALLTALGAVYAVPPGAEGSLATVRRVGQAALRSSESLRAAVAGYQSTAAWPRGPFGDQLRLAAQLLAADLGVRVVHLTLGGFDTHANQKRAHGPLLGQLSDGVAALLDDAASRGQGDRVAVLTYSEFGRRVAENASGGTDHGAAGSMFLVGAGVKGGLHGAAPDLAHLEDGDIKPTADFRSVYAAALGDWLAIAPEPLLGKGLAKLKLFA